MNAATQTEMYDSLVEWFQTFQPPAPHTTPTELSDGVAMAQALHQLAPDTFTILWLSKIQFEVGSNWRLKVINLKKVCAGAMEYYADCSQLHFTQFGPTPDLLAIAEKHDSAELGVLLQLVLGCAVNCPDKENYIKQIMGLEKSLQRNIMTALQQLENVWQAAGGASAAIQSRLASIGGGGNAPAGRPLGTLGGADLQRSPAAERADVLAQRCHEAKHRVAPLLEEKSMQELAKVDEELDIWMAGVGQLQQQQVIGDDGVSLGPVQPGSTIHDATLACRVVPSAVIQARPKRSVARATPSKKSHHERHFQMHESFSTKPKLDRQMPKHSNFLFQCSECNFSSNSLGSFNRHVLTHTVEKLFQCEYCGNRYKAKESLLRHMRMIHL